MSGKINCANQWLQIKSVHRTVFTSHHFPNLLCFVLDRNCQFSQLCCFGSNKKGQKTSLCQRKKLPVPWHLKLALGQMPWSSGTLASGINSTGVQFALEANFWSNQNSHVNWMPRTWAIEASYFWLWREKKVQKHVCWRRRSQNRRESTSSSFRTAGNGLHQNNPGADPGFWSGGPQQNFDPKGEGPKPRICSK